MDIQQQRQQQKRKDDHIDVCSSQDVEHSDRFTGFEKISLIPKTLPEFDFDSIEIGSTFLNNNFSCPLLITGMTGGTESGARINRHLAEAAQHLNIPMGVGSQRVALENPELENIFQVRSWAPELFLIANLGIAQLVKTDGVQQALRAIAMIKANAIAIHCNVLQELIQTGGDLQFKNALHAIHQLKESTDIPIVVKEVGFGMDQDTLTKLLNFKIDAIDVGGRGGTSWSFIEGLRSEDKHEQQKGELFRDWGIPTAYSLSLAAQIKEQSNSKQTNLIATGGLRDGVTIAKAIALGADMCGIGLPFFKAALQDTESVVNIAQNLQNELKVSMVACGAIRLDELKHRVCWGEPYEQQAKNRIQLLELNRAEKNE